MSDELARLWKVERPAMVATVAWAAANGDRSENGDYLYGKRRLREIDRRLRRLSKSLDSAVVVDNAGKTHDRVFFGATVTFRPASGDERVVTIVGVDELDAGHRAHLLAVAAGHGAIEGEGRRRRDAAHAARARGSWRSSTIRYDRWREQPDSDAERRQLAQLVGGHQLDRDRLRACGRRRAPSHSAPAIRRSGGRST